MLMDCESSLCLCPIPEMTYKHRMLLAKLHLDHLIAQNTVKKLQTSLSNLPKDLLSAFEGTMNRIRNQGEPDAELARSVLRWVVGAKRPLTLKELQCASAITSSEPYFDEDDMADEETMTRVCAGLLVIDDQWAVRLARK